MRFLIQTINGRVEHDFSFALIKSIEFQNWWQGEDSFEYVLTDGPFSPNFVPIGSVEFVSDYIQTYFNKTPKPKNIPSELLSQEWTNRNVFNGTEKDIVGKKFVKSNDKIKSFAQICSEAPEGNYQISDLIEIDSEWRAFVFQKELVGLQNYSGDFTVFPNSDRIYNMIKAFKSQPVAFTLDVAVSNCETVVVEVHDFFSCGLYGFSDYNSLPFMFSRWFNEFVLDKQ